MGHFAKLHETGLLVMPGLTFLIALSGSLHCLGMCGGLAIACSPTKTHTVSYHLGRLTSYLLLTLVGSLIGSIFFLKDSHWIFSLLPALMMGGLLIYAGSSQIKGRKPELPLPQSWKDALIGIWRKLFPTQKKVPFLSSAIAGSLSVFLPCGLLYGVVMAISTFNSPLIAMLSIFTFWLGTVPMLLFAPTVFKKLTRFGPKALPILMILIGLGTICYRVFFIYQEEFCS